MAYCDQCDHCNADLLDGDKIRRTRLLQGISLRQMAKDVGFTPSYISDIEHNRRRIHIAYGAGARIVEYLGLTPKAGNPEVGFVNRPIRRPNEARRFA